MAEKETLSADKRYKRYHDRTAGTGEYDLIEPLDTRIMQMLPDEGTLFADLYPLGETARNIAKKLSLKDAVISSTIISNRLRLLNVQGLVVKTRSIGTSGSGNAKKTGGGGGATVWQRTRAATEHLKKKGALAGGGVSSGTS